MNILRRVDPGLMRARRHPRPVLFHLYVGRDDLLNYPWKCCLTIWARRDLMQSHEKFRLIPVALQVTCTLGIPYEALLSPGRENPWRLIWRIRSDVSEIASRLAGEFRGP